MALCGVQFVDVLGVTVVITAVPRMLDDLGATPGAGAVVVTAYAMFFGGLLMVASRIGDRVGHRRIVVAALGLFALASALGALAGSVWLLALARGLQGVAAAASVPAALRLLTTVVPEGSPRRRAVAGWSAAGGAAGGAGFVVGGVVTEIASWRALFWVNIVLAAVLAAAILRAIPRDRPAVARTRIGWPSAILLTTGGMGIVAGTTLLGEHDAVPLAAMVTAAGVLTAGGFALLERTTRHPLVPRAARRSVRLRWGAFGSFLNTATTTGPVTVATFYLQGELGLPPLQAAAVLVSLSILVVAGSIGAPRLIAAMGWGPSLGIGLGIAAIGNGLLVARPSMVSVGVAAAVWGVGIGVGSVAANDMGTAVDEALKATAAGVLNTAAQLGTAIGTAVVLLVATNWQPRTAWALVAALGFAAALAAATRAPRSVDRTSGVAATSRGSDRIS